MPRVACPSLQGWAGGMVVLVVSGLATGYFNTLISGLYEYGGVKHTTYRDLAHHIMGAAR